MGAEDLASFDRWFDAYSARLVLYARQWVDSESAEDVVQEVFIRFMAQSKPPDNPPAWLYTSVRNAAIGGRRSVTRRKRREEVVAEQKTSWFEPDLTAPIDAGSAQAALTRLPDVQREVIMLRLWGGLPFAEIAAIMNAGVSTVFDQYKAGLAGVRKIMEEKCPRKTI
jgi:RNA polymerase sigma-70 factor (ECF subfamily)